MKGRFSKGVHIEARDEAKKAERAAQKDKAEEAGAKLQAGALIDGHALGGSGEYGAIPDEEWRTAARALRTASWGTIFYLITTDILGWGSTP